MCSSFRTSQCSVVPHSGFLFLLTAKKPIRFCWIGRWNLVLLITTFKFGLKTMPAVFCERYSMGFLRFYSVMLLFFAFVENLIKWNVLKFRASNPWQHSFALITHALIHLVCAPRHMFVKQKRARVRTGRWQVAHRATGMRPHATPNVAERLSQGTWSLKRNTNTHESTGKSLLLVFEWGSSWT